jgi:hypothetical protein
MLKKELKEIMKKLKTCICQKINKLKHELYYSGNFNSEMFLLNTYK